MTVRTPLVALALTALLASGCDPAADPAATEGTAASADPGADPVSETATEPPAETPAGDPTPAPAASPSAEAAGATLLTDVRLAHQEGFDRVTFEFSGPLPRYDIRYGDGPVIASGSGEELEVGGDGVLRVRMEPATGYDMASQTPSYDGPARLTSDTTNIVELVRVGDFEAVLEWAVGVRTASAYEVATLDDPPRIVVDVTAD